MRPTLPTKERWGLRGGGRDGRSPVGRFRGRPGPIGPSLMERQRPPTAGLVDARTTKPAMMDAEPAAAGPRTAQRPCDRRHRSSARAGLSNQAFYRHVASKDDLVAHTFSRAGCLSARGYETAWQPATTARPGEGPGSTAS